jgi:hypothetical protein
MLYHEFCFNFKAVIKLKILTTLHILGFYIIILMYDNINLLIKKNICIEISIICIWKKMFGYKVNVNVAENPPKKYK